MTELREGQLFYHRPLSNQLLRVLGVGEDAVMVMVDGKLESIPLSEIEKEKDGWKDISTAPKDRSVLTYTPAKGVKIAHFSWRWVYDDGTVDMKSEPSHWMDLPEPP